MYEIFDINIKSYFFVNEVDIEDTLSQLSYKHQLFFSPLSKIIFIFTKFLKNGIKLWEKCIFSFNLIYLTNININNNQII